MKFIPPNPTAQQIRELIRALNSRKVGTPLHKLVTQLQPEIGRAVARTSVAFVAGLLSDFFCDEFPELRDGKRKPVTTRMLAAARKPEEEPKQDQLEL